MTTRQTGLTFSEAAHRYRLDGRHVPSVTTLIKGGTPNDALPRWAAKTVAQWVAENPDLTETMRTMGGPGPLTDYLKALPWAERDTAAVRGTDVHAYAEQLLAGAEVEVPAHLVGYVEACAAFLEAWDIEPVVVERPVAHRAHWWAGKPDLLADSARGRGLFDWKTSRSIYESVAWQIAAYRHAEFYVDPDDAEQPMPDTEFGAGVLLRPDGTWAVHVVESGAGVYREFRHIATVAAAVKRARGSRTAPGYVGPALTHPDDLEESA